MIKAETDGTAISRRGVMFAAIVTACAAAGIPHSAGALQLVATPTPYPFLHLAHAELSIYMMGL